MSQLHRHTSWEALRERLDLGNPFALLIPAPKDISAPDIELIAGEGGRSLALQIPYPDGFFAVEHPLKLITMKVVESRNGRGIELRTDRGILLPETYNLFVSIIDRIQLDLEAPPAAIEASLEAWRDLLATAGVLSEERQLGLRGELFLLRRFANQAPEQALASWTGPEAQPHDFRYGGIEIEVKATRSPIRNHVIHGLRQLVPSPQRQLYILSLTFAPAGPGAGTTLIQDIHQTAACFAEPWKTSFLNLVERHYGCDIDDVAVYPLRLQLSAPPLLVPVNETTPRIIPAVVGTIPDGWRISDVSYRLNLDGLGSPELSTTFEAVLDIATQLAKHSGDTA